MPWAAIAGAVISAYAANRAAKAGQAGAQAGTAAQERMYQQQRTDLMPWANAGQTSLAELMERMGLATPGSRSGMDKPTQEQFMRTTRRGGSSGDWLNPGGSPGRATTEFDQTGYDQAMQQYNAAMQGSGVNPDEFGSLLEPFDLEKFEESPGYQFNLQQGMEAIRKGAAANSGTTYAPQTLRDMGKFAQGTASNEYNNAYNRYNQDQENVYGRLTGVSEAGRGAATQVGQAGTFTGRGQAESIAGGANAKAAGYIGVGNAINSGVGSAYNNYLQQSIINNQSPTYGSKGGKYDQYSDFS